MMKSDWSDRQISIHTVKALDCIKFIECCEMEAKEIKVKDIII